VSLIEAYLLARIEKTPECWRWTGAVNNGYGRAYIAGRLKYAHRAVYECLAGAIPEGLQLDHLCRNPLCVKPEHLEPVEPRENMRRGIKGVLTTHCPQGHCYDSENTSRRSNGHRRCRKCHNKQERRRVAGKGANHAEAH
jgi:hypothetical protein